jgi:hypothetical protein
MALSLSSVSIRVRAYLAARGQDASNLRNNRIAALVPDALRELVNKGQLRKTFEISAVNGEVGLTAALADSEPIILEELKRATITFDSQTYPAQYKADRSSLILPATSEFVYWTLEDTTMLVADENGLGSFTDDGNIRNAPFVAQLSSVTVGLESTFIQTLAAMLSVSKAA